ncbi:Protein spinster [Porphyridium purpureum]|uniref:Protein spinster n=1 Tax=Porphyridium purpureum TaxID=35688 RepID=A0A5J4YIA4_PORPP|nr:Protein spinster [Porphyridium purpureum]|eukprot:POR3846..scf297_16
MRSNGGAGQKVGDGCGEGHDVRNEVRVADARGDMRPEWRAPQLPARAGDQGWLRLATYGVLMLINALNFADRYALAAVLPDIREGVLRGISDTQAGALGSVFVVVYMLLSPVAGAVADRFAAWRVRALIIPGVVLWSAASILSGTAQSFGVLLASRALVGIGEAAWGPTATPLIADMYPNSKTQMIAFFMISAPVGAACGYIIPSAFASWRVSFFVFGISGLVLAATLPFLDDPYRQAQDGQLEHDAPTSASDLAPGEELSVWVSFKTVLTSRNWIVSTMASALSNLAFGAISFWMPTFLIRVFHLSNSRASLRVGVCTLVAGIVGPACSAFIAAPHRAVRLVPFDTARIHADAQIAGMLLVCSGLVTCSFGLGRSELQLTAMLVAAGVTSFGSFGPLNSLLLESVPAEQRGMACGVNVVLVHLLGDSFASIAFALLVQLLLGTAPPPGDALQVVPVDGLQAESVARAMRIAMTFVGLPVLASGLLLLAH